MPVTLNRRLTPHATTPVYSAAVSSPPLPAGTERFLADASETLAEGLDLDLVLQTAVQLPVPLLADICVLDLRISADATRRVVTQHSDPDVDEEQRAFTDAHLMPPPALRSPVSAVLASGDTLMHTVFERGEGAEVTPRALSSIIVGLHDGHATIGVCSFLALHPDRQFGPPERQAAELYARRVARAVRHAHRFEADRDSRRRAESQLEILQHTAEVLERVAEGLRRELDEVRRAQATDVQRTSQQPQQPQ
jgi:GAF domain-containing protein